MAGCRSTLPISLPEGWRAIITPLEWTVWAECLRDHPDQGFRDLIVSGLREGFRIGFNYEASMGQSSSKNMPSALERPEVVREYLLKECAEGRVIGPVEPALLPMVHTSRFGVIPKGTSGKWRLIVDLSSPEGNSVNDGISESLCSLTYVSVDDAARAVVEKGVGAQLAKIDIRSAYRIVPVHPDDRWLLGMSWEGALYVDTALPFGLRSAPKIFNAVAGAAEWMARQQGVAPMFRYLDDFLIVGAPGSTECSEYMTILLGVFSHLGIPVASEKLEGPTSVIIFLGIEIDTKNMMLRLPAKKLDELQQLVKSWQERRSCHKRELQALVGKLQHACKVVRPGRTFLRRMFEALSLTNKRHHHIRLNKAFRSDLLWWDTFLTSWNGVAMIEGGRLCGPTVHIYTDASGEIGCGAWWSPQWWQLKWTPGMAFGKLPITQKEVLPIVLSCAQWGRQWRRCQVVVHCDNTAAVSVVNSGYSRDPQIMHLLRSLFFIKAHLEIELWAVHIPGVENTIADAISRDNRSVLFSQAPEAEPWPKPVATQILDLLVEHQPDWASQEWTKLFGSCFRLA